MSKSIKNWELQDSIRSCVEDAIDDSDGVKTPCNAVWYLDQFLADSWFDILVIPKNSDGNKRVCLYLGENGKRKTMLAVVDSIAGVGTICHLFEAIIYKKLKELKRKD